MRRGPDRADVTVEHVRELAENGWTTKQIAKRFGVSKSMISSRLRGEHSGKRRRRTGWHYPKRDMTTFRHPEATPEKVEARLAELEDYTKRIALMEYVADVAKTNMLAREEGRVAS